MFETLPCHLLDQIHIFSMDDFCQVRELMGELLCGRFAIVFYPFRYVLEFFTNCFSLGWITE